MIDYTGSVLYANGYRAWYLNGKELTEAEFNARNKPNKPKRIFTAIDGVDYELVKVAK
jgi:hypothetical protein